MAEINLETIDDPRENDALGRIVAGLRAHNLAALGDRDRRTLAVIARDAGGAVVGGAFGELEWDWLHIHIVWVEEASRRRGVGACVMRAIEAAALDRGVDRSQLETTSFQSLDFYRALGYEVFGELEKPLGHRCYYMCRVGLALP